MAFMSNLLSVSEPSGLWISIIKAFEGATKNYVLAIILLTVVIRVVWAVIETFSKYSQRKMTEAQAKIQPEMEKLKVKYSNQPQVLQQKQNELSKKSMGKGYIGGCLTSLIIMALNLVIFFTLFSGLNSMAGYKMVSSYETLKNSYANCLNVAIEYIDDNLQEEVVETFKNFEQLEYRVVEKEETSTEGEIVKVKYIQLVKKGEVKTIINEEIYKNDFSEVVTGEEEQVILANTNIVKLIDKIYPKTDGSYDQSKDLILYEICNEDGSSILDEQGKATYVRLSDAVQSISMEFVRTTYDKTKDSFLWIENIWLSDTTFTKSITSYSSIEGKVSKEDVEAGEKEIYNSFMVDLKLAREKGNGYFLLPLLCMIFAFLSMYINTLYTKMRNKKKGIIPPKSNKIMAIIMPVILGLFALLYNSVFAIYMLTGQIVSTLLTPLQLMIIDKISDKKRKKDGDKDVITVEYSRKF